MSDKNNPRRCYVEDYDTSGAIVALMRHDNQDAWPPNGKGAPVYVIPPNDLDELLTSDSLHTELNGSGREALGIVLDAETQPRRPWERIKSFARSADPAFNEIPNDMPPTGLILVNSEGKRLGLWIMPDNKSPGMLEDWLRELVPDTQNELWEYAIECVTTARRKWKAKCCRDSVIIKAHLHTLLAWQDPPAAKGFVSWFKKLYGL
jgi:hypothetical protein